MSSRPQQSDTVCGSGLPGHVDGIGDRARMYEPRGIAVDPSCTGVVYFTDTMNNCVRRCDTMGGLKPNVTTVTACGQRALQGGYYDGIAASSIFRRPRGICVGSDGAVYVADTGNHCIRKIHRGIVTTLAGSTRGHGDGPARRARFNEPCGLCVDHHGSLYVADTGNHCIRKVQAGSYHVTTLCGVPGKQGCTEGIGDEVLLTFPYGLCAGMNEGTFYITDFGNHCIRSAQCDDDAPVSRRHMWAVKTCSTFGTFKYPWGCAMDGVGNLYVTDSSNHRIQRIDADGKVSTLIGLTGKPGYSEGGPKKARFCEPLGIAVDAHDGNAVLVCDCKNQRIRRVKGLPEDPGLVRNRAERAARIRHNYASAGVQHAFRSKAMAHAEHTDEATIRLQCDIEHMVNGMGMLMRNRVQYDNDQRQTKAVEAIKGVKGLQTFESKKGRASKASAAPSASGSAGKKVLLPGRSGLPALHEHSAEEQPFGLQMDLSDSEEEPPLVITGTITNMARTFSHSDKTMLSAEKGSAVEIVGLKGIWLVGRLVDLEGDDPLPPAPLYPDPDRPGCAPQPLLDGTRAGCLPVSAVDNGKDMVKKIKALTAERAARVAERAVRQGDRQEATRHEAASIIQAWERGRALRARWRGMVVAKELMKRQGAGLKAKRAAHAAQEAEASNKFFPWDIWASMFGSEAGQPEDGPGKTTSTGGSSSSSSSSKAVLTSKRLYLKRDEETGQVDENYLSFPVGLDELVADFKDMKGSGILLWRGGNNAVAAAAEKSRETLRKMMQLVVECEPVVVSGGGGGEDEDEDARDLDTLSRMKRLQEKHEAKEARRKLRREARVQKRQERHAARAGNDVEGGSHGGGGGRRGERGGCGGRRSDSLQSGAPTTGTSTSTQSAGSVSTVGPRIPNADAGAAAAAVCVVDPLLVHGAVTSSSSSSRLRGGVLTPRPSAPGGDGSRSVSTDGETGQAMLPEISTTISMQTHDDIEICSPSSSTHDNGGQGNPDTALPPDKLTVPQQHAPRLPMPPSSAAAAAAPLNPDGSSEEERVFQGCPRLQMMAVPQPPSDPLAAKRGKGSSSSSSSSKATARSPRQMIRYGSEESNALMSNRVPERLKAGSVSRKPSRKLLAVVTGGPGSGGGGGGGAKQFETGRPRSFINADPDGTADPGSLLPTRHRDKPTAGKVWEKAGRFNVSKSQSVFIGGRLACNNPVELVRDRDALFAAALKAAAGPSGQSGHAAGLSSVRNEQETTAPAKEEGGEEVHEHNHDDDYCSTCDGGSDDDDDGSDDSSCSESDTDDNSRRKKKVPRQQQQPRLSKQRFPVLVEGWETVHKSDHPGQRMRSGGSGYNASLRLLSKNTESPERSVGVRYRCLWLHRRFAEFILGTIYLDQRHTNWWRFLAAAQLQNSSFRAMVRLRREYDCEKHEVGANLDTTVTSPRRKMKLSDEQEGWVASTDMNNQTLKKVSDMSPGDKMDTATTIAVMKHVGMSTKEIQAWVTENGAGLVSDDVELKRTEMLRDKLAASMGRKPVALTAEQKQTLLADVFSDETEVVEKQVKAIVATRCASVIALDNAAASNCLFGGGGGEGGGGSSAETNAGLGSNRKARGKVVTGMPAATNNTVVMLPQINKVAVVADDASSSLFSHVASPPPVKQKVTAVAAASELRDASPKSKAEVNNLVKAIRADPLMQKKQQNQAPKQKKAAQHKAAQARLNAASKRVFATAAVSQAPAAVAKTTRAPTKAGGAGGATLNAVKRKKKKGAATARS